MSANVSLNSLYGRTGTAGRVIYALERSEVMEGKTAWRCREFSKTAPSRRRDGGDILLGWADGESPSERPPAAPPCPQLPVVRMPS